MEYDITWITAVYRDRRERAHIGVPPCGCVKLREMSDDLVGTGCHVALYVPEGTEDVYNTEEKRGRVIGLAELLPMPEGRTMEDYYYDDLDGSRLWPIGWPCRVVCEPPVHQCPRLREHVESLFGPGSFGGYVRRFHQQGPFGLEPDMRARLNRDFAEICSGS